MANIINEFNRDLQHAYLNCLFEEKGIWDMMESDGNLYEEGPFGDIEVDILDFLEKQPYYKHVGVAGRSFEAINLYDDEFHYEMSCHIDLHEALVKYDWENMEDEDEPDEILVDVENASMLIVAKYLNYKLSKIECRIFSNEFEDEYDYELWPTNELPDSFGGKLGIVDEV